MTECPLCGAPWIENQTTCTCGYDVLLVELVEQDRRSWRITRNVFGGMALAGIAAASVLPGIAFALLFIGLSGGVWSVTKVHANNRRLRDVAKPKQLPAARLRQP